MFKQVKKEKAVYKRKTKSKSQVVCGACGHVRNASASNPAWQCPNCLAAYAKVNKPKTKKETTKTETIKKSVQLDEKQEAEANKEDKIESSIFGIATGLASAVTSIAHSCVAVKPNPVLLGVGGLIAAGSLLYLLYNYFVG